MTPQISISVAGKLISASSTNGGPSSTINSRPIQVSVARVSAGVSVSHNAVLVSKLLAPILVCTSPQNISVSVGLSAGVSFPTLEWSQDIPLATWTILHNLNRHPNVSVTDTTGNRVEPDVRYYSANEVRIFHGLPMSGKAYLS